MATDSAFGWETFPFERDGLRPKELGGLVDAEPDRAGEGARRGCSLGGCVDSAGSSQRWPVGWRDDAWQVKIAPPSGSPLVLILEPLRHVDVPDYTEQEAARHGVLLSALMRAVEALPSVGRCQILRSGDGAAHGHTWLVARPARLPQVRGSWLILWDELLPPVPEAVRDANAAFVMERLAQACGGTVPPLDATGSARLWW